MFNQHIKLTDINNMYNKLIIKNLFHYLFIIIFFFSVLIQHYFNNSFFNSITVIVFFAILFGRALLHLTELLHEAIHFNFIPKNKEKNDLIANLFFFPFFFSSIEKIRKQHFLHHSIQQKSDYFLQKDPETFQYSLPIFSFVGLFKDLSGFSFFMSFFVKANKNVKFIFILLAFYYLTLIFFFNINFFFGNIVLIAYLSIYPLLNRVRIFLQHRDAPGLYSRNLKKSFLNYLFTSEYMFCHEGHHKNPSFDHLKLNEFEEEDNRVGFFEAINFK